MRSMPAIVAIDEPIRSSQTCVDPVTRTLMELIEMLGSAPGRDGGNSSYSEEVLIDTEVGDSRYLLLRMPKVNRGRIQLSPREQEIVRMVAKGHPNKVIADVLNITEYTTKDHLKSILAKLDVPSRSAAAAWAVRHDLG